MGVPTAHYKAPHACPSLSVATHHRQPFSDLVPRDLKRQVPLANNAQIQVPPGSRHPIEKLAALSERTLPSQVGTQLRARSSPAKVGPIGNTIPTGPVCLKS